MSQCSRLCFRKKQKKPKQNLCSPNLSTLPLPATGWRLFDDSTVTMVEESQVVTRYAYVLFYRRQNSPVERPPRFLVPGGAESPTAADAAASQVRAPQIPIGSSDDRLLGNLFTKLMPD